MGKIIGEKKLNVKTFTQEEVNAITLDLNAKIVELTETKDKKSKKEAEKSVE